MRPKHFIIACMSAKPAMNSAIIGRCHAKCFIGHFAAEGLICAIIGLKLCYKILIIGRVCDDGHKGMVLGASAYHSRPANINILNTEIKIRACRNCLRKGVEIDHDKINGCNIMGCHGLAVTLMIASAKQTTMDKGVQGFDSPIHDFWKACHITNITNSDACLAQCLCRSAC